MVNSRAARFQPEARNAAQVGTTPVGMASEKVEEEERLQASHINIGGWGVELVMIQRNAITAILADKKDVIPNPGGWFVIHRAIVA